MKAVVVAVAAAGLVASTVADAQEPAQSGVPVTTVVPEATAPPAAPVESAPAVSVPELAAPVAPPAVEPPPVALEPAPAPAPAPAMAPATPAAAAPETTADEREASTSRSARRQARRATKRARQQAARDERRAQRRAAAAEEAPDESSTGASTSTVAPAPSGAAMLGGAGSLLPGLAVGEPIPSFLIERFRIPPFLLSIYQAAGVEYGIRWEILAAINEIETDYGRNLNVSSAGAQGWMQFMPATWRTYGTDANDDGRRDPYNPVDAIFAAARYLKAAGYQRDVRGAIFAYNHADWYVNSVLSRAQLISLLPGELIGSLTGLTEGRFPIAARASYATRATPGALRQRGRRRTLASEGSVLRRQVDVAAAAGSAVVAVQDGRVTRIATKRGLGRFLQLRDVYGNTYTYANLGSIASRYLTPRAGATGAVEPAPEPEASTVIPPGLPLRSAGATGPRTVGEEPSRIDPDTSRRAIITTPGRAPSPGEVRVQAPSVAATPRDSELRRNLEAARAAGIAPARVPRTGRRVAVAPASEGTAKPAQGGAARRMVAAQQLALRRALVVPTGLPAAGGAALVPAPPVAPERTTETRPSVTRYTPYQRRLLGGLKRRDVRSRPLRVGSTVVGGTVLGRVGKGADPHLRFRIRPAGEGTPLIDPTPILDGWRLLDSSAVYRGAGDSALRPEGSSVGRILLESKDALVRRVLTSPDIELYECGRRDVAAGLVDRRVLATLAFLAESGLEPTVSSLRCGHGRLTSSGNVSEHTTGTAVDIAAINGVPIIGHQGPGSVTEQAVRKLLTLQGTMKPHQIISLLAVPGTDNTLAMADHADHIHIGFRPGAGASTPGTTSLGGALRKTDWQRLVARLNAIPNPLVPIQPTADALPVTRATPRGSR